MQFLEYYSGGLRSPILSFEKAGHPVVFRLFPIVHIGDPAYYVAVLRHLGDCDRVLYEYFGTFHPGPHPDDHAYGTVARRLGLTAQMHAIDYTCVPANWVHAGFSPGQAEQAIAALPDWKHRIQFTARTQAIMARLAVLVPLPTRAELAETLDMSQMLSQDLMAETPLDVMIMDDRNRVLFNALKRYHQVTVSPETAPFIISVFYGAAHMPAVADFLSERLGYLCRRGEWIEPPVFTWRV